MACDGNSCPYLRHFPTFPGNNKKEYRVTVLRHSLDLHACYHLIGTRQNIVYEQLRTDLRLPGTIKIERLRAQVQQKFFPVRTYIEKKVAEEQQQHCPHPSGYGMQPRHGMQQPQRQQSFGSSQAQPGFGSSQGQSYFGGSAGGPMPQGQQNFGQPGFGSSQAPVNLGGPPSQPGSMPQSRMGFGSQPGMQGPERRSSFERMSGQIPPGMPQPQNPMGFGSSPGSMPQPQSGFGTPQGQPVFAPQAMPQNPMSYGQGQSSFGGVQNPVPEPQRGFGTPQGQPGMQDLQRQPSFERHPVSAPQGLPQNQLNYGSTPGQTGFGGSPGSMPQAQGGFGSAQGQPGSVPQGMPQNQFNYGSTQGQGSFGGPPGQTSPIPQGAQQPQNQMGYGTSHGQQQGQQPRGCEEQAAGFNPRVSDRQDMVLYQMTSVSTVQSSHCVSNNFPESYIQTKESSFFVSQQSLQLSTRQDPINDEGELSAAEQLELALEVIKEDSKPGGNEEI